MDAAAAAAATALTNGFESADATVAGKAAVELSKLGATKEEIIFAAQIAAEASAGGASLSEAIRQAKAKFISNRRLSSKHQDIWNHFLNIPIPIWPVQQEILYEACSIKYLMKLHPKTLV